MPGHESGRRCRQCGEKILWGSARFVGSRTFCWEPCAIMWLFSAASRTSWRRIRLEVNARRRSLWWRLQLAWVSWFARTAQRRLDRRLAATSRASDLPWFWLPSVRGTTALLLALAACGISGGPAPELMAMTSVQAVSAPSAQAAPGSFPAAVLEASPAVPTATVPLPSAPLQVARAPEPPVPAGKLGQTGSPSTFRATTADTTRGDTSVREIAFTFDGGSDANIAGDILDSLRARNVRATMFLTGQFIRLHPEWVRRIVADGHEIGNHLDTHPHLTTYETNRRQQTLATVTREFLLGQLRRAEESLVGLTGQAMAPLWRAPFGEHNAEIRAWAAQVGYRHISWTRGAGTAEDLDTRDWVADRSSRSYRSREEIAARIVEFGNGRPEGLNGGIVLMHLGTHRRTDRPHEMLPDILKGLQAQGYRLVTISQLLQRLRTGEEPPSSTPSPPVAGQLPPTQ